MSIEIIRAFIDGIIIGVLSTFLIHKICIDRKLKKYEITICSAIDKLLTDVPNDLPIEKEDELL